MKKDKLFTSAFSTNDIPKDMKREKSIVDEIEEKLFKKLGKKVIQNKGVQPVPVYIDYFGEMLPLSEAIDRFYKHGVPNKKSS